MNANPSNAQCPADDHQSLLNQDPIDLVGGTATVLDARTGLFDDLRTPSTDKEAVAHAKVAGLNIPQFFAVGEIKADLLSSRTTVTCNPLVTQPGGMSPGSFSTVTNLSILGQTFNGNAPAEIPLVSPTFGTVGTIRVNWQGTANGEHIRRALWLDFDDGPLGAADAIFAQSRSGCGGLAGL